MGIPTSNVVNSERYEGGEDEDERETATRRDAIQKDGGYWGCREVTAVRHE